MSKINVLDKNTIDKIAAGEVVDRPSSVVKELLENAIDAKATAVTVEIKEGGISLIRITDNGEGISKNDVQNAFLRHATSKIATATDLLSVHSLGFRGEALSSIAAVAQVECISKTQGELIGVRYVIEGGEEKTIEEVGAPSGTTFIVRNLFYNTPARRKFLKTAATEASYISSIIEKIALSHPDVSIRFITNSQSKLHTSGNGKLKDIIYTIFGRDICANMLEINGEVTDMKLSGYIGKPMITRGNRNHMVYFINGRYIKSKIIYSAIEEAYKPYIMQHNYPFCVLHFEIASSLIDVNVHPSKMEIRFENQIELFNFFYDTISTALKKRELIPDVKLDEHRKEDVKLDHHHKEDVINNPQLSDKNSQKLNIQQNQPSKFDNTGYKYSDNSNTADFVAEHLKNTYETGLPFHNEQNKNTGSDGGSHERPPEPFEIKRINKENQEQQANVDNTVIHAEHTMITEENKQLDFFDNHFLSKKERIKHKMIGQLFDTYWLIEYDNNLYIIDQHAAHEKVLYEKTMSQFKNKEFTSQQLNPPIILTLSMAEEELLNRFMEHFTALGYEIESFGGREYAVRAVPGNLYSLKSEELLMSLLDNLSENSSELKSDIITDKIASMSCKAAVKGNNRLSFEEADALIEQLLSLDNPYNCPHGRPTIISMSKYEIEKKFKRIL